MAKTDGIFNWSNKVLVLCDVAYHCMVTIGEAGSTYDEQWRVMKANYEGNQAMSYSRDTHRWAAVNLTSNVAQHQHLHTTPTLALQLQEGAASVSPHAGHRLHYAGFQCPICCPRGAKHLVVIVDGKVLGLSRAMFKDYTEPVVPRSPEKKKAAMSTHFYCGPCWNQHSRPNHAHLKTHYTLDHAHVDDTQHTNMMCMQALIHVAYNSVKSIQHVTHLSLSDRTLCMRATARKQG